MIQKGMICFLFLISGIGLSAQKSSISKAQAGLKINPAILLEMSALKDTAKKKKNFILPILGDKAREYGADLPNPIGVGAMYMMQSFDIVISDLGLSVGDNPIQPVDFIKFGTSSAFAHTATVRGDVWILPFLNIGVQGGYVRGRTSVELTDPIAVETEVEYNGKFYGFGMTVAYGIENVFITANLNWTWFDSELTIAPVAVTIAGLRGGYNFSVGKTKLALMAGTMLQDYSNATVGSISLEDALPLDNIQDKLNNYDQQQWYLDLGKPKQIIADEFVTAIQDANLGQTTINYSIAKRPADKWNILLGARWEISKRFEVIAEAGFLGRTQVLIATAYRFPI